MLLSELGLRLGTDMFVRARPLSSTVSKALPDTSLGNRTIPIRPQTHSLAFKRVTTALFSTRSSGLRILIEIDMADCDPRSTNTNSAEVAFQISNPFDDPKAHSYTIRFTS